MSDFDSGKFNTGSGSSSSAGGDSFDPLKAAVQAAREKARLEAESAEGIIPSAAAVVNEENKPAEKSKADEMLSKLQKKQEAKENVEKPERKSQPVAAVHGKGFRLVVLLLCFVFSAGALGIGVFWLLNRPEEVVAAETLTLSETSKNVFLNFGQGTPFTVTYTIGPDDTTQQRVEVSLLGDNAANIISVNNTSLTGITGTVTITPKNLGSAAIQFKVRGTELTASVAIHVYANPVRLAAPTELRYNDSTGTITFRAVPYTTTYAVVMEGRQEEVIIEDTSGLTEEHNVEYELFSSGEIPNDEKINIRVKAKGDNVYYLDSETNNVPLEIFKLGMVENVAFNNGILTWDAKTGARGYVVKVNNVEMVEQTATSFDVNVLPVGSHAVSVKAILQVRGNNRYDSSFTEARPANKLAAVSAINIVNDTKLAGMYAAGRLTWELVENATIYKTEIENIGTGQRWIRDFFNTDTKSILLDGSYPAGSYKIKIQAFANADTSIPSQTTQFNFTKLAEVSNIEVSNNTLTFAGVADASSYEISFVKGVDRTIHTTTQLSVNLESLLVASGVYQINIKAVAANNSLYANGELKNTNKEVMKLAAVDASTIAINSLGQLTFTGNLNASNYEIYVDSERIQTQTSTTYMLPPQTTGSHTLQIKALGDGITYINSSLSVSFAFRKLEAINTNNVTVINNVISWPAVSNAQGYWVKINNEDFVNNGVSTSITIATPLASNTISVIVLGNNTNIISSNQASFIVNQLTTPTGFALADGELTWATSAEADYYASVIVGVSTTNNVLISGNKITGSTFAAMGLTSGAFGVKLKAVPKLGQNYLNSAQTQEYVFTILPKVTGITLNNPTSNAPSLSWGNVTNASGYAVSITTPAGQTNKHKVLTGSFNLSSYMTAPGAYTVKVRAVGSTTSVVHGEYITSAEEEFVYYKLSAPSNVYLNNDIVSWAASGVPETAVTPVSYEVLVRIGEDEYTFNTGTNRTFNINDLTQFTSGSAYLTVRAIGGGAVLSGETSAEFELIKLDTVLFDNSALALGIIGWHELSDIEEVSYLVFVEEMGATPQATVNTNSVVLDSLLPETTYTIRVVAVAEGYVSSAASAAVSIQKLALVSGFTISGTGESTRTLSWTNLTNNNGYEIIREVQGENGTGQNMAKDTTSYEIPALLQNNYTFKIAAKGGSNAGGVYYLASEWSEPITVAVLQQVTNVAVENGKLNWTVNRTTSADTPANIKLEIQKDGSVSVVTKTLAGTATNYNFADEVYEAGTYTVSIISVGSGSNQIDSAAVVKTNVIKIDVEDISMAISYGTFGWEAYELNGANNVTYDLFVGQNTTPTYTGLTQLTHALPTLTKGVATNVYIRVNANNLLSSDISTAFSVTKLSNVTGFAISLVAGTYTFSWNDHATADGFILQSSDAEVEDIEIDAGATGYDAYSFVPGDYTFRIRPMGGNSYLNGDYSEVPLTVHVLPTVSNAAIVNGILTWTNEQTSGGTGATAIIIQIEEIEGDFQEEIVLAAETTSYNFVLNNGDLPAGNFSVKIMAKGNATNIVNSELVLIENITKLETPNNIAVINGVLTWGSANAACEYELYINNEKQTLETPSATSFNHSGLSNGAYTIKLRAVGDGALSSEYTPDFTISKLAQVTGFRVTVAGDVSKFTWNAVPNASGYRIYIGQYTQLEYLGSNYNYADGYVWVAGGTTEFIVPDGLPSRTYSNIQIAAVGNVSLALQTSNVSYLNGAKAGDVGFTVFGGTGTPSLNSGRITWDPVTGASRYKVEVYDDPYTPTAPVKVSLFTASTFVDVDFSQLTTGAYRIFIYPFGDGVNYITNSGSFENMRIYKQPQFETIIVGGEIYWYIPYNDPLFLALNSEKDLEQGDVDIIKNIFKGDIYDTDYFLLRNLYGLMNTEIEVINSSGVITTQRVVPTLVESSANTTLNTLLSGHFVFTYSIRGWEEDEYTIRIRPVGNRERDGLPEGGTGQLDAGNNLPAELNLVNGKYSKAFTATLLPAPRTPVHPEEATVNNNKITFTPVNLPNYSPVYLIQAVPDNPDIPTVVVTKSLLPQGVNIEVDLTGIEFSLQPNVTYTIYVFAVGTLLNTNPSEASNLFLTSAHYGSCAVVQLNTPQNITVIDGVIRFSAIPQTVVLNIWNGASGTFEEAVSNRPAGFIKERIEINEETALTAWGQKYILPTLDGFRMDDNPMFNLAGEYKISLYSEGDGTNTLSSPVTAARQIYKYDTVERIHVLGGVFRWKHVESAPAGDISPQKYLISVYKNLAGQTPEWVDDIVETVHAPNIDTSTGEYRFELPDNNKYAGHIYDSNGENPQNIYYSITVKPIGNELVTVSDPWMITGDAEQSEEYRRLESPKRLTVREGKLYWDAVIDMGSYEIYINGDLVDDYSLAGGSPTIEYDLPDSWNAGLYRLKVRAITQSYEDECLNGVSCEPILAQKLEEPNLRVENGTLKWNTTQLEFATASSVALRITGPSGFTTVNTQLDYNHAANSNKGYPIKGTNLTAPPGTYTATVKFNGATGAVNTGEEREYFWLSSKTVTLSFEKVATPQIDLDSETTGNDSRNYIYFEKVENASYYNVVVSTKDRSRTEIFNFDIYDANENTMFKYVEKEGKWYIEFNLSAVTAADISQPDATQFGADYYIYAEGYGDSGTVVSEHTIYGMSNNSNELNIEIPQTPRNLAISETGLVTWQNVPEDTNTLPELVIEYKLDPTGSGDWVALSPVELPAGTTSYPLTVVAPYYRVKIRSKLAGGTGGNFQSDLSANYVSGAFMAYALMQEGGYVFTDGSAEHPYRISSSTASTSVPQQNDTAEEQLKAMYLRPNAHFILMEDVALTAPGVPTNGNWVMIDQFSGVLNGNGKAITGLQYRTSGTSPMGFINTLAASGEVKNLRLSVSATGVNANLFGGIAANNYGKITNCKLEGTVAFATNADKTIGGVVGNNYATGTVKGTVNAINLSAASSASINIAIGGIAYLNQGTITESGNEGNITAHGIGGIAYRNEAVIAKSYNHATFTALHNTAGSRSIGGVAGINTAAATINACYSIINTLQFNSSASTAFAGGLVGSHAYNASQAIRITNSYAYIGTVNGAASNLRVGIILGTITGTSPNVNNMFTNVYYVGSASSIIGDSTYSSIGSITGVNSITTLADTKNTTALKSLAEFEDSSALGWLRLTWESSYLWA